MSSKRIIQIDWKSIISIISIIRELIYRCIRLILECILICISVIRLMGLIIRITNKLF